MLEDVPREVFVVTGGAATLWALVLTARQWLARVRRRQRFVRGAEGESEAAALLERHGFVIEGAQVMGIYTFLVDGVPQTARVRADYLVVRDDQRWVVEVKTGRLAPRLETPATRRQLLEYQHAFAPAGILLVDADTSTLQAVSFAGQERGRSPVALLVLVLVLVLVLALVLAR